MSVCIRAPTCDVSFTKICEPAQSIMLIEIETEVETAGDFTKKLYQQEVAFRNYKNSGVPPLRVVGT